MSSTTQPDAGRAELAGPPRGSGLAEQLAARFAERIEQRLLAAGARLPSVRDCAARHGVSPSTVVGAYDLLQARGLVEARPQRGFFEAASRRLHWPFTGEVAPADGWWIGCHA